MALTPTGLSPLADGFYLQQQQTARRLANATQGVWAGLPSDGLGDAFAYWRKAIPVVASAVTAAQYENAAAAETYVHAAAAMQGAASTDVPRIAPTGLLSATEDVERWLRAPIAHLARLVVSGADFRTASTVALSTLLRQTTTLAQDAGREATGVGIAVHPGLDGYFRKLRTPSCSRCAVLAGAYYKHSEGFLRHPKCDCVHVPAAKPYDDAAFDSTEAIRRGQITGLSEAERTAILDHGADVSQVINARRKGAVSLTQMFGQTVETTTSGTSVRGLAGKTLGDLQTQGGRYRVAKRARLTPDEIFRQADGDKALARRLLERNAYVV